MVILAVDVKSTDEGKRVGNAKIRRKGKCIILYSNSQIFSIITLIVSSAILDVRNGTDKFHHSAITMPTWLQPRKNFAKRHVACVIETSSAILKIYYSKFM